VDDTSGSDSAGQRVLVLNFSGLRARVSSPAPGRTPASKIAAVEAHPSRRYSPFPLDKERRESRTIKDAGIPLKYDLNEFVFFCLPFVGVALVAALALSLDYWLGREREKPAAAENSERAPEEAGARGAVGTECESEEFLHSPSSQNIDP